MTGDNSKYQNFGNVGAMGDAARSDNNTFVQSGKNSALDLAVLVEQLSLVRAEMKRNADSSDPAHDVAIGVVAQAEAAAKAGEKSKALEFLKGAGKWALDTAKSVAAELVKDAIEGRLGS